MISVIFRVPLYAYSIFLLRQLPASGTSAVARHTLSIDPTPNISVIAPAYIRLTTPEKLLNTVSVRLCPRFLTS